MSIIARNPMHRLNDSWLFPNDFFSTLDLSNIKNGPKVCKSIWRQVKNSYKSSTRAHQRDRSLDLAKNYDIATPDIHGKVRVRLPKINTKSEHSSLIQNNYSARKNNAYINPPLPDRRRLQRFMKSEDRLRK